VIKIILHLRDVARGEIEGIIGLLNWLLGEKVVWK
jgi:hypothetical protein